MMKDGVDRISELPDSLKESILDCLPITDAVRTSILSSEWRYTWTFRKRLDFNMIFSRFIGLCTPETYPSIIDRILVLHHGPIEHVSLCIPKGFTDDMTVLNAWLLNWSRKGIKELQINAYFYRLVVSKFFPLPYCLFQCQSLRSLKLICCELKPPPDFCGFFNLVTLRLSNVKVLSDSLGAFISRCTQLENLHINFKKSDFFKRAKPLIINAPNLRNLELWDHTPGTIVLQNVPLLYAVSLHHSFGMHLYMPVNRSKVYGSFNILFSLGKIEKLDCDLSLIEPLNGVYNPLILLMNLKTLRLNFFRIFKREDIEFIFCILRSAPCLQTLHIHICQETGYSLKALEVSLECLEVEEMKANKFNKLVTIHIGLIKEWYHWRYVYEPMFKLINILLSSCPVLKTLYVAPDWGIEPDAVKLELGTKLFQFHPLSSNARITVCGCVCNGNEIRCVNCQAIRRIV